MQTAQNQLLPAPAWPGYAGHRTMSDAISLVCSLFLVFWHPIYSIHVCRDRLLPLVYFLVAPFTSSCFSLNIYFFCVYFPYPRWYYSNAALPSLI